jgi:hypothetical protein
MSEIDELKRLLIELRRKVRQDLNIHDELHTELVNKTTALEQALEKLAESKHVDSDKTIRLFKNAERLLLMLEDIKKGKSYPSYVDDFVPSIAQGPYTMPRNLFEPQGAQQITINAGANSGWKEQS